MRSARSKAWLPVAALMVWAGDVSAQDNVTPAPAESVEVQSQEPSARPRRNPLSGIRSAASSARNRVAGAARNLTSPLPGGAFSVSGAEGSLLETVDPSRIQTRIVQQNSMGLSNEGNNVASFEGLRLRMPETERALTGMIARLDEGWPHERSGTVNVFVIASNEYGPETLPDGSIMVKMGLLNRADSDDEVALMLGHELSHVRLGHFADDGGFRRKRQLATMLGQIYFGAVATSEIRARQSGDQIRWIIDDKTRVEQQRDEAAEARALINELMTLLFERTWARRQEDEADALGFDLTVKANMAASGAAEVMYQRIDVDHDLKKAASDALFDGLNFTLATAFNDQNSNAIAAGNAGAVLESLNSPLQRIMRDRTIKLARDYFGQRHRTPEARLKGIRDYSDRAHPDMIIGEAETTWLTAVRGSAEYREATIVVESLRNAGEKQKAGDLSGAVEAMRPALATRRFGASPVVANTLAGLYAISGNINEAERLYTIAHRSEDQSTSAYVEHAWMLVRHRRYTRAREVISLGTARLAQGVDGEKPFLPSLTAMAFQQKRKEEGLAFLQRCLRYEEEALTDKCVRAAMGLGLADRAEEIDLETQVRIDAMVRQTRSRSAVGGDLDAITTGLGSLFN